MGRLAKLLGMAAVGGAVYAFLVRPWHMRWGATDEEVRLPLPGDELLSEATFRTTHAIAIAAPPEMVWPWLVQLGQGRGGFYSYDWIENLMGLNIHTADTILPEFQDLKVGDVVPMAPDGFGFPVAILEPNKSMVLYGDTRQPGNQPAPAMGPGNYFAAVWGLHLTEMPNGSTRLIERFALDYNRSPANLAFISLLLEPGSFIMEQKMLRTIKDKAERLARPG